MDIIDLYKDMLAIGNMTADKEGCISGAYKKDDAVPVVIKGKRMVLPTENQLKNADWSNRVVFHPLYEHAIRGESVVLTKYSNLVQIRINVVIGSLIDSLLQMAASNAEHHKLNPDQSEFLRVTKNVDEKTLSAFSSLVRAMPVSDSKTNFVSFYLKRNGTADGKKYARVGVVSFPFFDELTKDGEVYGVKLRQKDREIFKNVMEYLFKDVTNPSAYNRGSDSGIAPYLDALVCTFVAIIGPINDVIDLFGNTIEGIDQLLFDADFITYFDRLNEMRAEINAIPMLPGNEGTVINPGVAPEKAAPVSTTVQAPVQVVQAAPVVYQNWNQPPVVQHQPINPVTENGKLDFHAIMSNDPSFRTPAYGGAPMQQQQHIPRFAQQAVVGFDSPPMLQPQQQWNQQQQQWGRPYQQQQQPMMNSIASMQRV